MSGDYKGVSPGNDSRKALKRSRRVFSLSFPQVVYSVQSLLMLKYSPLQRHFELSEILKLMLMQSVEISGLNQEGYHSVYTYLTLNGLTKTCRQIVIVDDSSGISDLLTEVKQKSWYLIAFIVAKYVDV